MRGLPAFFTVRVMDDMGGTGYSTAGGSGGFSRRQFLSGVVVVSAAAGLASVTEGAVARQDALASSGPPSGPPTTTLPLPTTTAPEQLLLTWGRDPATAVTVSWSAPGTVPMPAPTLAYSTSPITRGPAGPHVRLPEPQPLDVTRALPAGCIGGQLHRRTERPDDVPLPRRAPGPGARHSLLLPGQRRRAPRRPRPAELSRPRRPAAPGSASLATATWRRRPRITTPQATSGTSPATTPATPSAPSRTLATVTGRRCSTS